MKLGRRGFTLVELIVVMIIVAILASVAIPMMSANTKRAKQTEAQAALGSIRTAERLYRTETGKTVYGAISDLSNFLAASDLNGKYYNGGDYAVTGINAQATPIVATDGWVNLDLNTGNFTNG